MMSFFYVFILVKKYFSYSNANKNIPQEGKKMQTSKVFKDNLKNKIITEEMLNQALYSANKRAKNYRDKAREYSFFGGAYYDIAREKKEECYRLKERLLQILTPTCIHVETQFRYPKVYDYEPEYNEYSEEEIERRGHYYEYMEDKNVHFIVLKKECQCYYLFYDLGTHSYHTPITSPDEYQNLEIVEIDSLVTKGADYHDLVSLQFVRELIKLIESGDYSYVTT